MINKDTFRWRKSSFSGGGGNECIEIGIRWRKSSVSGGDPNACVEVADTLIAIRDSKNPDGPVLRVDLQDLLVAMKDRRLGR